MARLVNVVIEWEFLVFTNTTDPMIVSCEDLVPGEMAIG